MESPSGSAIDRVRSSGVFWRTTGGIELRSAIGGDVTMDWSNHKCQVYPGWEWHALWEEIEEIQSCIMEVMEARRERERERESAKKLMEGFGYWGS